MLLPLLMLISANTPLLSDTRLYREVANNCKNVDLENWQHPTRKVLLERGVILKKVELCNDGKYPIYHVRLPYDPAGQTQDYFNPLYVAMYGANGKWPYAMVDEEGTIVYMIYRKGSIITPDYELFSPQSDFLSEGNTQSMQSKYIFLKDSITTPSPKML